MSLTEQEKKEAKQYALKGANFMFLPSVRLMQTVARGEHPNVKDLPPAFIYVILQKKAIKIDTDMIIKYCDNTLDIKNTWVLDQGDIKVIPQQINLDKGIK